MKIIPAIDILNGKCVRLLKGNYSKVTEYNNDPLTQVNIFKKAGFKTIHIVDLNAAKTGGNENLEIIKDIANIEEVEIQVGGGCLLYTSPSPRDGLLSRMPSSA